MTEIATIHHFLRWVIYWIHLCNWHLVTTPNQLHPLAADSEACFCWGFLTLADRGLSRWLEPCYLHGIQVAQGNSGSLVLRMMEVQPAPPAALCCHRKLQSAFSHIQKSQCKKISTHLWSYLCPQTPRSTGKLFLTKWCSSSMELWFHIPDSIHQRGL